MVAASFSTTLERRTRGPHTMLTRLAILSVLCLVVSLPSTAAQVESKHERSTRPNTVYGSGTAPVVLSDGSGDRSLTIGLDGYGSFGSATPANDATFDPVGSIGPAGTVYRS